MTYLKLIHKSCPISIIQRHYKHRQPLCYILAVAAMNSDVRLYTFPVVIRFKTSLS